MFKRLLVPLDGSPLAEAVLPYVKSLATQYSAEVLLVRVVPNPAPAPPAGTGAPIAAAVAPEPSSPSPLALVEEEKTARAYLRSMARDLRGEGIECEWTVKKGAVPEKIMEAASDEEVDMIAISTHGRTGVGRMVFGSVADRLLRESGRPTLVVRPVTVTPAK